MAPSDLRRELRSSSQGSRTLVLPPPPPAEQAAADQHQTGKSSTSDGAGDASGSSGDVVISDVANEGSVEGGGIMTTITKITAIKHKINDRGSGPFDEGKVK
jgi:hypothetical protein